MPRTIQYEGRTIQLPDDANDDEVRQALEGMQQPAAIDTSGSVPAPADFTAKANDPAMSTPMPSEQSFGDYAGGVLDQIGRGLAEGMISIPTLPNTLSKAGEAGTNWLLNKAGVPPEYAAPIADVVTPVDNITPSQDDLVGIVNRANNATADVFNAERPRVEPENTGEAFANRVSEVLGGALVPVGGALVTAERVGVEGARRLPGLVRGMVEPAAVNPAKFAARETTMALGAGTGSATANQMFDPATTAGSIADFIGGLLGGGAVAAGGMLRDSAGSVFNALRQNPKYVDQVVNDAVVDRLGKAANLPGADIDGGVMDTKTLVDAIGDPNIQRPSTVIPGYQETLADATRNPGIAALEYGRQQGANAGLFAGRRTENSQVVDAVMRNLEPKEPPATLRDTLSQQRDSQLLDAIQGRVASQDEVANALRPITPASTQAQRGGTVRTALEEARDAARAATDDAYANAGVDGKMVDPAPLAETLDDGLSQLSQVERTYVPANLIDRVSRLGRPLDDGPQPTGVLDASGNPIMRDAAGPAPIDIREATTLRSDLQNRIRALIADPTAENGGRNAARVMAQMQARVDDYITKNLSPDEAAALDVAKATKFDEAERFTRQGDPVADVLGRYKGGQPKVRDDMVAGKFVNPQAMDRLFAQADTPSVRAAIRDEVLSKGDTTSAARIDQFVGDYGQQIDKFPGLREELATASKARNAETSAIERQALTERDLGTDTKPGRSTVGKYLQYSDANSERAISEVLAAKDPAKAADELLSFAKDAPKAVESARAAFWQKMRSESQSTDNTQRSMDGGRAWRGDWMKSWLDKPATKAVAERLYRDKPEDLAALNLYAEVLDNADLRVRGKATATSGTTQGMTNIMTPETLQSRGYAYMRGQISGTYLATSIAAVVARRAVSRSRTDAIERITDKALLNPAFAKELLKENNPANRAALASKTRAWFGSETNTLLESLYGDNEDDKDPVDGR